jgi:hypothetical protein
MILFLSGGKVSGTMESFSFVSEKLENETIAIMKVLPQ